MWHIYLLSNSYSGTTYIGCTTDPDRRLRQHNREIKGGARSTLKYYGHWYIHMVLSGFKDRAEAMRWERIVKIRFKGLANRSFAFIEIAAGRCPGKGKQYSVPIVYLDKK